MATPKWIKAGAFFLGLVSWFTGFEIIMLDLFKNSIYNLIGVVICIFMGVVLITFSLGN